MFFLILLLQFDMDKVLKGIFCIAIPLNGFSSEDDDTIDND